MRGLVGVGERPKLPVTFFVLVAVSVAIGIYAGSKAAFQFKTMFYALILSNVLIAAYLLLIKNVTYGILVYLYSLTFLNFYWRIVLPGRWPDLDIPRLVFVFLWLVFLLEVALGVRKLLPRTKIEIAMLFVVAAVILSMSTNGRVQIRQLLNGFAIPYAMFVVSKNVFRTEKEINRLIYLLAVPLSIYFPVNHMFEHYRLHQFVFPRYILSPQIAGQEIYWGQRTMGVFLQPSATGMAMVSIFVLSLYGLSKSKRALSKIVAAFITMLTPVAVFFTYTRSVYLGFFMAMTILALFSRRMKIYGIIIISMIFLGILANWDNVKTENRAAGGLATKHTVQSRLVLYQAGLAMFQDHPFRGVGFMRFQDEALPYVRQVRTTLLGYREAWMGKNLNMHNHFLNMLIEVGLIGFVPLVLVYYFTFRILIPARKRPTPAYDSDFVVAVWAVFAQYLSNAMFMEPRFFEFMNVLPFMLAAIIIGGQQRLRLYGKQAFE